MNLIVGLPLMLLGVMLQGSVLAHLRFRGGQPDLVLLVVVAWSLLKRGAEGMVWAFTGGLLLDLFSGAPPGVSSVGLVMAAYVAGLGPGRVTRKNVLLPLVMAVVGTAIFHGVTLLLLVALDLQPATWREILSYVTLPSAALNLALALPVFQLVGLLHTRLYPRIRSVKSEVE